MEAAKVTLKSTEASSGSASSTTNVPVVKPEATGRDTSAAQASADAVRVDLSSKAANSEGVARDGSRERLEKAAERFQEALNGVEVRFNVNVEEESEGGGLTFKVVDKETGRVVRQFPADESPELMPEIGNLVDSQV